MVVCNLSSSMPAALRNLFEVKRRRCLALMVLALLAVQKARISSSTMEHEAVRENTLHLLRYYKGTAKLLLC